VFGEYVNDDTGWNIEFSKGSSDNVAAHGAGPQKIALIQAAPELIETGVFLETVPKNKQDLKTHIFAVKATIDGEVYAVSFAVREDGNGRRYYDHSLIKIEALDRIDQAPLPDTRAQKGTPDQQNLERPHSARIGPDEHSTGERSLTNILKKHLAVNN